MRRMVAKRNGANAGQKGNNRVMQKRIGAMVRLKGTALPRGGTAGAVTLGHDSIR